MMRENNIKDKVVANLRSFFAIFKRRMSSSVGFLGGFNFCLCKCTLARFLKNKNIPKYVKVHLTPKIFFR